uniref:Solute carrier family 26 member 5 n=1 Tax=Amphilophus citrinellus TaxID=61819 RepID=A0A3Q0THZ5_AMPCI
MEQEETAVVIAAAAREGEDSQLIYRIQRPVYNETVIRTQLLNRKENTTTVCQKLAQKFQCSSKKAKAVALSFLPILTWLPSYPVKKYLFADVVSGLSTGVVQLPQGLAYALLAAVPPVYGLYSSFYPVLLYTFFGTSRHVSIGTFAVISLMIGGVAVREAPDNDFLSANASNMSEAIDVRGRDAKRIEVAVMVTTLVGIIQIVLGLLRFGFVAIYLTEPLVRGFTTAASMHVVISQLKYLLGVETQRFSGPLSAIYVSLNNVRNKIPSTNVPTLLLGLACLVFLYVIKVLNERFKKKLPIPIPGEIIIVIVSTGVSYGLSLSKDYNVHIVGTIPTGLLLPTAPNFFLLPKLLTDSFAIAIVGFSMDISLAKIFALKYGYSVDGNQELIALGLCNFIGSFFQTFSVTSSMSRSLVQESTGGKTQFFALMLGSVFQTALAAIIMVNLIGMFKQFRDIPALWRTSKIELAIWLAAFVASVLLGLDYGLLVSIAFAILTVIYRTQSPKSSIMGHVPDTGLYCDVDEYEEAAEIEGIKIFHSNSSIYFANSDLYVNTLKEKTGINPEDLQTARKYKDEAVTHEVLPQDYVVVEDQKNGQLGNRQGDSNSEEAVFLEPLSTVHSIILDWTAATFIDSVGAKAIKQAIKDYATVDVRVVIACCNRNLLVELDDLQFFTKDMTTDIVFPTVHDAVLHCLYSNSHASAAPTSSTT